MPRIKPFGKRPRKRIRAERLLVEQRKRIYGGNHDTCNTLEDPAESEQPSTSYDSNLETSDITVQDRICRPCLQRADRFVTTQIRAQEEAALASQRATTDDVPEPSFSQISELLKDSLRATLQEHVADIPLGEDNIASEKAENEDPVLPKVFCPKCNGDVSQMSGIIHEDETKKVIANVYNFFEQEYAELKKRYRRMDLTPLSKFSERTALATGVSESTVLEILQERARRNADVPQKPVRKRRSQPERIELQRPSQERTLFVPTAEDARERCSAAVVTETLVIKEEPPEADYDEPEIFVELPNVKMEPAVSEAYMDQADPIDINLKIEPRNDATEQASTSSETQGVPRATTRYTALSTQQHTGAPPASLFPPATHTLQVLQRHAGHLRVRSTHMHEDGLS